MKLDDLPVELLENIYIHSQNLNLPKVCRLFYYVLNAEVVRLNLCSSVFAQEYTNKFVHCDASFATDNEHDNGLVHLQSTLFEQRWYTMPFAERLQEITPTLQKRTLQMKEEDKDPWEGLYHIYAEPPPNVVGIAPSPFQLPHGWPKSPWLRERLQMFLLLRDWCIAPRVFGKHAADVIMAAKNKARIEDRDDIVAALCLWFRPQLEVPSHPAWILQSQPVNEALLEQYEREAK